MNENVEEDDYVRHNNPTINGGLGMTIEKISEDDTMAQCSHIVGSEAIHKVEWFALADLTIIHKADGGFLQ